MPSSKLGDYEVLETIGSGSYGNCRKVRRKADDKVCKCNVIVNVNVCKISTPPVSKMTLVLRINVE